MSLEGMVLGHYRLKKWLHSHDNVEVYRADNLLTPGKEVAVKVLKIETTSFITDDDRNRAIKHFNEEAEIVSKLDHRYILSPADYGYKIIGSNMFIYLVMPYKKDGTLKRWLVDHADNCTLKDINHIVQMAAEALQYVHDQHIIHGDVKPSNFLIEYKVDQSYPQIYLSDFGMSKITDHSLTTAKGGTPEYMAPEQWARNVTQKSDQYALAIIAYQLVTGLKPFQGNDEAELIRQHKFATPQLPSKLNQTLHPIMDDVILKALAKKPWKRYSSISTFAAKFQEAILRSTALNNTQPFRAIVLPSLPSRAIPLPSPPPPRPRTLRLLVLTCILALLVVSAVVILPPWIHYNFVTIPGTATAIANVTATSRATATASAMQATAIAQVTATAGVIQTATTGTPKYNFPLTTTQDTTTSNAKWDGISNSNSPCTFKSDGYHVPVDSSNADPQICQELGIPFPGNFSTYSISVNMLITNNASGGLMFDIANNPITTGYFLEVSPSTQSYKFSVLNCTGTAGNACTPIFDWHHSSAILPVSQVNLLQATINGDNFSFYINGTYLPIPANNQQDNLFANGYLGFASAIKYGTGEAIFSNLKIFSPNPFSGK